MPRQIFAYILLLLLQCLAFPLFANNWRELSPGIEYQDLGNGSILTLWSHIHAFRIDLKKNHLELVMAKELSKSLASVEEFARFSHALIATNGGFFDQENNPLGLRVSNQQQHNPIKPISWWGVFYINKQRAYLSSPTHYSTSAANNFAIQSGPRLVINGKIPTLKPGYAERTALGITANNQIILVVTENAPLTASALASIMASAPLRCRNALNLDGGSSTQLVANIGSFQINKRGYSNVSDAIIVKGVP